VKPVSKEKGERGLVESSSMMTEQPARVNWNCPFRRKDKEKSGEEQAADQQGPKGSFQSRE
jgi:hypothetical protein